MAQSSNNMLRFNTGLSAEEKEEIRKIIEQIPTGSEVDENSVLDKFPTDKYLAAGLYLESLIDDSPDFHNHGGAWVARVWKVVCPVCGTFIGHTILRDITVINTVPTRDWKCPSCGAKAYNLSDWKTELTLQKK